MENKILVVGGYGSVGQVVASALGEKYPGRVIAAGRNYDKAKAFSAKTKEKVLALALDVLNPNPNEQILRGVELVIMCLDQPDTRFVEFCLKRGISYVDVTANADFLADVERLDPQARDNQACALLSVGLSPGLTNILAKLAKASLSELERLDIFILLGLGDAHGEAAVRWTVENINRDFTVIENGRQKNVSSFEDGLRTDFPGIGDRMAYRFNLSDQHVIPRTLGINTVSTRLGFDLDFVTKSFAFLKKAGALNLLSSRGARELLVKSLQNYRFGSEQYVIQVRATGQHKGEAKEIAYAVAGEKEARGTGKVAALLAERLIRESFPAGVFHSEQLVDPEDFITELLETNASEFRFLAKENGAWNEGRIPAS